MSATATITVGIALARLSIALIFSAVNLAAVLASVGGHLIRPLLRRLSRHNVVPSTHFFFLPVRAVIHHRSNGSRTEAPFDQVVTLLLAAAGHLSAAGTCAFVVIFAAHSLAPVQFSVSAAWLALVGGLGFLMARHLGSPLAGRTLRLKSSRLTSSTNGLLPIMLVSLAVLWGVLVGACRLLWNYWVVVDGSRLGLRDP